jgi:hypothetical protein
MVTIGKQLEVLHMDMKLHESLLNCINCTLAEREINRNGPFSTALEEAQAHIGWPGMLHGSWMNEWQQAYECKYPVSADKNRKQKNKCLLQVTGW